MAAELDRRRSATVAEAAAERGAIDPREALRYLGLSDKDPRAHALLLVCDRYGLDPLLGHISIQYERVYVHFAAYLHLANQHPAYQGMECVREWDDARYCYAEVRVHRSDRAFPFQRRGKSLKQKPKKGGGTYLDHDADAKAFAQAARRALRLAFNVEWPEPAPEYDPAATEPPAPGPVHAVARRVAQATPPAEAVEAHAAQAAVDAEPYPDVDDEGEPDLAELDPNVEVDPETGEVLDEHGWPPEPDDDETSGRVGGGPIPTHPAGATNAEQMRQAQREATRARRRSDQTSAVGAQAPPGPAADQPADPGLFEGGETDG